MKLWRLRRHEPDAATPVIEQAPADEQKMIASAIRTDLILSAEIMVIALDEVADEPFLSRLLIYDRRRPGDHAVGLRRCRRDRQDGRHRLHLARTRTGAAARFGERLVAAMPKLLAVLSLVGMVAMLWVGGHILLAGVDEAGWALALRPGAPLRALGPRGRAGARRVLPLARRHAVLGDRRRARRRHHRRGDASGAHPARHHHPR